MRIYELTTPAGDELAVHYADGAAVINVGNVHSSTGGAQIELPDDELERLTAAILATLHGLHPRQQQQRPTESAAEPLVLESAAEPLVLATVEQMSEPAPYEAPDGARFAAAEAARELLPEYADTTDVLGVAHWLLTGEIPPITAEQVRPAVSA